MLIPLHSFHFPSTLQEKWHFAKGFSRALIVYFDKTGPNVWVWYDRAKTGDIAGGGPILVGQFLELLEVNRELRQYEFGLSGRPSKVLIISANEQEVKAYVGERRLVPTPFEIDDKQILKAIETLAASDSLSSAINRERKNTKARSERKSRAFLTFIAYDDSTGLDFAEHLKQALEKRNIASFVAKKDLLPYVRGGRRWREITDDVIETCNTFILILSTDMLTEEVAREVRLAIDRSRASPTFSIVVCHLRDMPRTEKQLMSAGIDLKEYQQCDFTTKEDLVRKVILLLDNRGIPKDRQPGSTVAEETDVALIGEDFIVGRLTSSSVKTLSSNLTLLFQNKGYTGTTILNLRLTPKSVPNLQISLDLTSRGPMRIDGNNILQVCPGIVLESNLGIVKALEATKPHSVSISVDYEFTVPGSTRTKRTASIDVQLGD